MPEQSMEGMPAPPPKKEGFFSHKQPEGPDYSGLSSEVNTLSRRLRLLEEAVSNLRRFFQVTEENIIAKHKHFHAELKTVASDISEIRKDMQELKDKMMLIIKELQSVARKQEVKVLERYINMWNPIKFVTHNEVEDVVKDIVSKQKNETKDTE